MCSNEVNLGRFLMNICNFKYQFFEEQVKSFVKFENGIWKFKLYYKYNGNGNKIMNCFYQLIKSFDSAPDWVIQKLKDLIE